MHSVHDSIGSGHQAASHADSDTRSITLHLGALTHLGACGLRPTVQQQLQVRICLK